MKLSSLCLAAAASASLLLTACNGQSSILSLNNGNTPVTTGWEWEGGAGQISEPGVYGTLNTAANTNIPGARNGGTTWTDSQANMWLAGGFGFDSTGSNSGYLGDLWKMNAGVWTWVGGPNVANGAGIYGTLGTAATLNDPGGHFGSVEWTDAQGNFWLFGGNGYDSAGTLGQLNSLWKYNGQWAWEGGSNLANQPGVYGTLTTTAPGNVPGSRQYGGTWTDAQGNFWMFGGNGYDSTGSIDFLNDLWKFSPTTGPNGEWTWEGGSNLIDQKGTYGTLGTAAAGNIPGARVAAATWVDSSGNFWLFGGFGLDSVGMTQGDLNDLWEYTGGQWKWVGGSNMINQTAVYGTEGTAATGNVPGARDSASGWADASGNLWLFGGENASGAFDDLWEYKNGEWVWVSGADVLDEPGAYVTAGTLVAGNLPGGRSGQASWKPDSSGNFWIFGGSGIDANDFSGYLDDLWKFVP